VFDFQQRQELFVFSTATMASPVSYPMGSGAVSQDANLRGHEAGYFHLVKVKLSL
jgi:hypothetical protein